MSVNFSPRCSEDAPVVSGHAASHQVCVIVFAGPSVLRKTFWSAVSSSGANPSSSCKSRKLRQGVLLECLTSSLSPLVTERAGDDCGVGSVETATWIGPLGHIATTDSQAVAGLLQRRAAAAVRGRGRPFCQKTNI